ncbi:unnamed protein product [Adineta steineri]|uniref:AMOP domain-containing protein n=3 Tax=Adineta steineri TaxID=433720 RepID=A0A813PJ86_9BILA|nr:unnamed protein product [Adineta steineri]
MRSVTYTLLVLLVVTIINGFPSADDNMESYKDVMLNRDVGSCLTWYALQGDPQKLLAQTLPPPCNCPASFPPTLIDGWTTDPECDAAKQPNTCDLHKGAYGCYRYAFKSTGPGAQACYDKNGKFISDPWKGAGTVDAETPLGDIIQQGEHFLCDVLPYYSCCKLTLLGQRFICDLYYEKRPPGQCVDKPAI